ncbi:hypothetical protein ACIU1J_30160 [Azospirillum doebereinerae]|uniref:hypothetical protein n=1 Tax=Azospirillum doebereinerae TaxID=92933 RepID=UPI001EE59DC8|nr:hypothetical protein [Azospirillum doebereinerae]MCG5240955.1 hypothetical protein [Azospirillum doebereinerae]
MKRFVSIWLPTWPTERWLGQRPDKTGDPVVLTTTGQGGMRITAVNNRAADEGLVPGLTLAEG